MVAADRRLGRQLAHLIAVTIGWSRPGQAKCRLDWHARPGQAACRLDGRAGSVRTRDAMVGTSVLALGAGITLTASPATW
jgi:hypothetical protein